MKENRLVVADSGWAESIPEWIKEEIKQERLTLSFVNLIDSKKESPVGDAEVVAYLYTLGLRQAISHELANVYFYLTGRLFKRKGNRNLPDFIEEKLKKGLEPDEERELNDLRRKIYTARGGEISSPLFDALRQLRKGFKGGGKNVGR